MNNTQIYHACRVAFMCGEENVPWPMVLHAIREGLGMKELQTEILTEEENKEFTLLNFFAFDTALTQARTRKIKNPFVVV